MYSSIGYHFNLSSECTPPKSTTATPPGACTLKTQDVLSVLVFAECPEHGQEIGFIRQLSNSIGCLNPSVGRLLPALQHVRLLRHRWFSDTR